MNTETYRFECECREWIKRVNHYGRDWWESKKNDLRKRKGEQALQKLIDGMNAERKK